jgi:hypothetical protein
MKMAKIVSKTKLAAKLSQALEVSEKQKKIDQGSIAAALELLGDVRAKMRPLKRDEEKAKAILFASGLQSFESDSYLGLVDVQDERRLDLEKLKEHYGAAFIEANFYKDGTKTSIKVTAKT